VYGLSSDDFSLLTPSEEVPASFKFDLD